MKNVIVYSGRFQPFGPHHYQVYKNLINKFGPENVYIATSNKVGENSPLNFNEKKFIITKFDIPENKIVMVKNPYSPSEVLTYFDENETSLIVAVGEKDADRINYTGKRQDGSLYYYTKYQDNIKLQPYSKRGYILIIPHVNINLPKYGELDSTALRNMISKSDPKTFKSIFGWFNSAAYNMMKTKFKLNEVYESVKKRFDDDYIRYKDIKKKVKNKKLNEIGDASATPYDYKMIDSLRSSNFEEFKFSFITYSGTKFITNIEVVPGEMGISFKTAAEFSLTNNFKDLFRVMATVTKISREVMRETLMNINAISFSTPKNGEEPKQANQREKLYLKYIKNVFPNAKVRKDLSGITVKLKESKNTNVAQKNQLLLEGGSYGHIKHIFNDMTLKFNDVDLIVQDLLSGEFKSIEDVREKVDGQNLMVTYVNGDFGVARNKSSLKSPMNIKTLTNKKFNNSKVGDDFINTSKKINNVLSLLDGDSLNEIFLNGRRFLNIEILNPNTSNVIKYSNETQIICLGMVEYDNNFNITKEYLEDITDLIQFMNSQGLNIKMLENISIRSENYKKVYDEFVEYIRELLNHNKLSSDSEVGEYYKSEFEYIINQVAPNVDNDIKNGLINRWALKDKSFRLSKNNLGDDYESIKSYENDQLKSDYESIKFKLEKPFIKLSSFIFKNVDNFIVDNEKESSEIIKNRLLYIMKDIKDQDIDNENLKINLKKLEGYNGEYDIYPTEGFVLGYNSKKLKLTGIFAVINQILGSFKY